MTGNGRDPILAAAPPRVDAEEARKALEPTLWLLERANEGIKLTQTGALNRALVREFAERWPAWWEAELFGPPHGETDVNRLWELHQLLRAVRLLRRRGPKIFATKRGRELEGDPAALLQLLTDELLAADSFEAACAELAAEAILAGATADFGGSLAARIRPAIIAQGWEADGEQPDVREISWAIAGFLRPAEAIGLFERKGAPRVSREPLVLREAGRVALIAALQRHWP